MQHKFRATLSAFYSARYSWDEIIPDICALCYCEQDRSVGLVITAGGFLSILPNSFLKFCLVSVVVQMVMCDVCINFVTKPVVGWFKSLIDVR